LTIYVIEDHPLMREAVVMLVRRIRPGAEIVEAAQLLGIEQTIDAHGQPELFCLDLKLPGTAGVDGVRLLKDLYPGVPLAVISGTAAADAEDQCLDAGADVYIEKSTRAAEIGAALRAILTPETVPGALDDGREIKAGPQLSKRQQQLIVMLDEGLSNRDIAARLGISEHTVKVHLWRLFRRIGVKSCTQTLHYARVNGWLNP
jgi:DNA-binding NarL/FixJ family response regulator